MLANRYQVAEVLGSGGMGTVYRATDLRTGGSVAVKVLHPSLAGDREYTVRLRREASIAASLNSPRIVRVTDLDEHAGAPFLVMEYVSGPTLQEHLQERGRLSVDEAVALAIEVARALMAAHELGIVHRDLKPNNIKLVDGQVKVLDFGLARVEGTPGLTMAGVYLGTPEYSAPEQAEGVDDARSDLYALGVIMYELVAGRRPFRGRTPLEVLSKHTNALPPPLGQEVPADVRDIIATCLAKTPGMRYQTAAELTRDLESARGALVPLSDGHAATEPSAPPGAAPGTLDLPRGTSRDSVLHPRLPSDFPALGSPTAAGHNLPGQISSFVGRERELERMRQLLGTTRLLTLTGDGGVGKTRLALRVAEDVVADFPDGVWLVELAPVSEPALMLQVVAAALRVREQIDTPLLSTLVEALRHKHTLLVLDNCEHLLAPSAEFIDAVLRAGRSVKIVVTSRESLGVPGETVYRVSSLSLPDDRAAPPIRELLQYDAVRLFVDRATAALPTFSVTTRSAPAILRICRRLDGIPLALELAAARVGSLSPAQVAERLDDRFSLLSTGNRAAMPRQQTLRAVLDWSYNLLSDPERTVFARLSVFAGSWTVQAAEVVCAGDGIAEHHVLELHTHLVEKSLVLTELGSGDEMRYRLLETVRQYAREKLTATEGADLVHERYVGYFLRRSREAAPHLAGGAQVTVWLNRLERERDDVRAVMHWLLARGDGERVEDFCESLWRFWMLQGSVAEAREWLEGLLHPSVGVGRTIGRSKALQGAGVLAVQRGDRESARALFEESMEIASELGDGVMIGWLLSNLAHHAQVGGDFQRARVLGEKSLAVAQAGGDRLQEAVRKVALAEALAELEDHRRARVLLGEGLTVLRDLEDTMRVASTLKVQGHLALAVGDAAGSASLCTEALELSRAVGNRRSIAETSLELGFALAGQGEHAFAGALAAESLAINRERGEPMGTARCLELFGCLAVTQGAPERGLRLIGAAQGLRQAMGRPIPPTEQRFVAHALDAARRELDGPTCNRLLADGHAMPLAQAVESARMPS